jgi:predicted ATPase/DNA-binding CsgD family transcriptional regulator
VALARRHPLRDDVAVAATRLGKVSEREAQILADVSAGLSNAQIAGRLHISVRTVEGHVSSLLRKYGVADRHALAAFGSTGGAASRPAHLPGLPAATRNSFVGRAAERDAVLDALAGSRLVTMLGPGGVGKTRLASVVVEAAMPLFPSGGAFVDLVPVPDGFVTQAVAAALQVTEAPRQTLEEAIGERLGRGRSLLLLDNCEHLLDEVAGFVEGVLAACPDIRILVTTRERLRMPEERVVPIRPLPMADAQALFRDRALAADPELTAAPEAVADLCARLDGLPLAIELAAARSASLGAPDLLTALGDYLRLLAGSRGVDVRHRSLRAVLDWSHELLDEEERTLFRRLAVFAGSFDLAAAARLASVDDLGALADTLGRLVDKSLVIRLQAVRRWRMLATVRAYALEQLETGDDHDAVTTRYVAWAADTAEALEARLRPTGDRREEPEARPAGGWREEFDAVAADLRAALAVAPDAPGGPGYRLARSLGHLTYARRFLMEALEHYQDAARRAPSPGEAARDLRDAAYCVPVTTMSGLQTFDLLRASAERSRSAGDGDTAAVTLARAVELVWRAPALVNAEVPLERLRPLLDEATATGNADDPRVASAIAAAAAWTSGPERFDPDQELAATAVAAAREAGDPVLINAALDAIHFAAVRAGRLREAHRISRERLALLDAMDRDEPHTAVEIADTYNTAYHDSLRIGDLPAALGIGREIAEDDLLGKRSYLPPAYLLPPLVLTGELHQALPYSDQMLAAWQRTGRPPVGWLSADVAAIALAYGLLGDRENFLRWRARVTQVGGAADPRHPFRLGSLAFIDARTAVHTGDRTDAPALVDRALGDYPGSPFQSYARSAGAELAVLAGLPDAADRLAEAEHDAAQNDWASACLARAAGRLHNDPAALARSVTGWERIGARFERAVTLLLLPDRAAEGQAELTALRIPPPGT